MMKTKGYDEYQLANRHKIAYQTLIILYIFIWVNGYLKSSYGIFAEPYLESLLLMMIPGFYFASASIWQNAYFRLNDYPKISLFLFGFMMVVTLLILGLNIASGSFHLVENGKLGGDIELVLFSSLFTMMFILLVIRRKLDQRS